MEVIGFMKINISINWNCSGAASLRLLQKVILLLKQKKTAFILTSQTKIWI
jgi:hypothetical protein